MKEEQWPPHALGRNGEEAAISYLKRKKYQIVTRGFRLFRGEIDIIAHDKSTLVFIEVKTRRSLEFGPPEESVTAAKQKQIRKIAQGFLALHGIKDVECRFDVLSLIETGKNEFSIHHIENAF
ncbi:MAG: YraN family protein [Candidatus Aminicenantales bacterium]